jgi:hypothetical protein
MDASVASLSTLLIERDGTCFAETRHLVFAAMLTASDCAAQCHEPSGCRYARGRFRDMAISESGSIVSPVGPRGAGHSIFTGRKS